jgi:hypothetical protein
LNNRNRETSEQICRRHGDIEVKSLRPVYGTAFALGFLPNAKLSDALAMLDDRSLAKPVDDHKAGTLETKIVRS